MHGLHFTIVFTCRDESFGYGRNYTRSIELELRSERTVYNPGLSFLNPPLIRSIHPDQMMSSKRATVWLFLLLVTERAAVAVPAASL